MFLIVYFSDMYPYLIFVLSFFTFSWATYTVDQLFVFQTPIEMSFNSEDAITSLGELKINSYVSNSESDTTLILKLSYYTYPDEVLEMLDSMPDLVDTLLASVASNIAVDNGGKVQYNTTDSDVDNKQLFRIKIDHSITKGMARFYKNHMIIQLAQGDEKTTLSNDCSNYFKRLRYL